ncbi:MAG TPA: hypothetical protein PKC76_13625, partial [Saprospiraceae bacterium]|nr:hypothetical protein [Saprospiraceae bacterium]
MRVTLAAAFLLLFSLQGFNQVVIWEEDFESYPNGTVTAPPKWTAAGIDCDDPGLNIGNRFGVYDGAFWVQDVEGAPCCSPGGSGRNIWQSQSINIAAYSCVSVSLDIDGGGDMECDFPAGPSFACNNSHDQVVVEYILDGVLTQFPGGYICGLNGIGTISVSDLKGITLTIRVTLGNKANDEYYTIDNVVVTGSLLATPTITGPTTVCDGGASINLTANPAGLPSYEWSDGATGRVNSINTPGVYTVTVRNAAGCEVTSAPFTVNSAPAAPVTITGPSQICATGGTATLTANPAGLPSYQWSTGQTTRAITVSNGDVYTVTVTNAAGCTGEASFLLDEVPRPSIDPPSDLDGCGAVELPEITGSDLPGTEAYFTGANGSGTRFSAGALIPPPSRTLFLFASVPGLPGCSAQETVRVNVTQSPNIFAIPNVTVCNSYTLPPVPGTFLTGNRAYYTGSGATGTRFNPGDVITTSRVLYAYAGSDDCNDEREFTITIVPGINVNDLPDQSVCAFYVLPPITGTGLTGNQGYYTGAGGTGTRFNAGDTIRTTRTLFIYDSNAGCSDEESVTITITNGPEITPLPNQIICNSYTLPTITGANLSGNQAYYTEPNGGGTRFSPGDIITTSQRLYIYDAEGACSNEQSFVVTIVGTPDVMSVDDVEVCGFYVLPAITGDNLTGNQAYYTLANGSGTRYNVGDTIFTPQSLFIYDGAVGCSDEEVFNVNILSPPMLDAPANRTACTFFRLPAILGANLSGNEAYYTEPGGNGLSFNPGDTIRNSGTYFIFDDNGLCTDEQSFTITINAAPALDPVSAQAGCLFYVLPPIAGANLSGNEAYFTAPGGMGTRYAPGDTLRANATIFVFDDNGTCTAQQSFMVRINTLPTVTLTPRPVQCHDQSTGSIEMTVQGAAPFIFNWSVDTLTGQQNVTGLLAGFYSVTVTDSNGCAIAAETNIVQPESLIINCLQLQAVSGTGLSDGQAQLTIAGGTADYTITWTGPSNGSRTATTAGDVLLDNLPAGTYEVTLTDANNCTTTCSFAINVEGCDLDLAITGTDATCANAADGSIQTTLTGGTPDFTYTWNVDSLNGQPNPTNLAPGTYLLNVVDANNCVVTADVVIAAQFAVPTAVLSPGGSVCEDDCFDFTVNFTGAPPFLIDVAIDAGAGPQILTRTTDNFSETLTLCPADFGLTDGLIQIRVLKVMDSNCLDETLAQTATLTVQPLSLHLIETTICETANIEVNGVTYDFANPAGTEVLAGAAANGCDSIVTINLSFFPTAVFDLQQTLCENDEITINGTVYNMSNPNGTEILLEASVNGCDSIVNINLDFFPPVVNELSETLCEGESILVNGITYDQNNPIGTEVISGITANGCDSIINVRLDFFPPSVFNLNETLCEGESIEVNGVIYNQNNPNGTEILVGADVNGCDSIVNITLNFFPPSVFNLNETLCEGESIEVNGVIYNQNNLSGTEVLISASVNGCDSIVNITLNFFPPAVFDLNETLCEGASIEVNGVIYNENNPSGTEVLIGAAATGCDSTVNISLNYIFPSTTVIEETLCPGESRTVNGVLYNQNNASGTEVILGGSVNGCDSIINITLNFFPPAVFDLNETLCEGESIEVNGVIYNQNNPSGTEVLIGASSNGCDSIVNITLNFFPPSVFNLNETLCEGASMEV